MSVRDQFAVMCGRVRSNPADSLLVGLGLVVSALAVVFLFGVGVARSPVVGLALVVAAVAVAGPALDDTNNAAFVALFGVALAGLGTYLTTSELDKRQNSREERTRSAAVVGTARLMQEEFYVRLEDLAATWARGDFPDQPHAMASTLSNDARTRVTSELSAKEWTAIAAADVSVGRAKRLYVRELGHNISDDNDDRPQLCDAIRSFRAAALALDRLAGRPPIRLADVPPTCPAA